MSADFSIKPAGAPVQTPIVRVGLDTPESGVSTQLPAQQAVTAPATADQQPAIQHNTQQHGDELSRQVTIDRDAAAIVYQVVDNRSGTVIRQFPDQAVLTRRAYFRAQELKQELEQQTPAADVRV